MISVDTLEDNKAFALKEHADFPMLSNPDKKVAFAYQVIAPEAPADRQFAKRYTYYIDPAGKIAFIDKAPNYSTTRFNRRASVFSALHCVISFASAARR